MSQRIIATAFAKVYPMYVGKAERKGRTKEEVDTAIFRLTGYNESGLRDHTEKQVDF